MIFSLLAAVDPVTNPLLPWLKGKSQDDAPGVFVQFISAIVGLLLVLAAIWAFFQLLLGGFNWISSGGDKSKLEAAQQKIVQAVIGLFVVFAAWAIFLVLMRFLGITGENGEFILKLPKIV